MVRVRHGLAILRRVDGARQDAVHVDVAVLVLGGQAFGQRDHGGFGGAIGGHVRLPLSGGACRDIDDTAVAAIEHVRNDGAAAVEDGTGVEVEHEIPVVVLGLVQRRSHGEAARDIGEDVYLAETAQHPLHHVGDRLGPQQIGGQGEAVAASRQLLLSGGQGIGVSVHQRELGTLFGESQGDGPAEIAAGTGDYGYLG